MTPDTTVVSEPVADHPEVMASVDEDGSVRRFVIADITRDDAWLRIQESEATSLQAWR